MTKREQKMLKAMGEGQTAIPDVVVSVFLHATGQVCLHIRKDGELMSPKEVKVNVCHFKSSIVAEVRDVRLIPK